MQIVVIAESAAYARWVKMMAAETGVDCSLDFYDTGIALLEALGSRKDVHRIAGIFAPAVLPFYSLAEFIELLRDLPECGSIPVVAIVDGPQEAEIARDAGLKSWMQQPVTSGELRRVLEELRARWSSKHLESSHA